MMPRMSSLPPILKKATKVSPSPSKRIITPPLISTLPLAMPARLTDAHTPNSSENSIRATGLVSLACSSTRK